MPLHYQKRIFQRVGLQGAGEQRSFAANAKRYGVNWYEYEKLYPEFYSFLRSKAWTGKLIKIYKGYVCVCNKSSKNNPLTTLYPIPDEFVAGVEQVEETMRKASEEAPLKVCFTLFAPFERYVVNVPNNQLKDAFPGSKYNHGTKYSFTDNGKIKCDGIVVGKWNVVK